MLEKLRIDNQLLITKYYNNEAKLKRQLLIETILKDNGCFFKINMEEAINILNDLEYKKDDLEDMYQKLTSFEEYKKYRGEN